MAYYSSAYSGSDYGEYNFNSYALNYDYAQTSPYMTYSSYEYNQPYFGYDPNLYYAPNYPAQGFHNHTISYSATTYSDPKSIVYDPNYGTTQLVISYSNLEFNEPEFDDYDPTPYGGGYDIDQTYGKPLPPSDKICYPRSGSSPISEPFSGSIVPLPTIEEKIEEKTTTPHNGTSVPKTEEKPQSQDSGIDQPREEDDLKLVPYEDDDSESEESNNEDDNSSESDIGSGFGGVYNGGHGDEYEKQVAPQYPSGYGLEAVDLCESLFGYWPCLASMKRRECGCEQVTHGGNYCQENMWKGTADYLFGNPDPYSGRGEDQSGYGGDIVYGYQRHYPMQSQYRQIDYTNGSW